MNMKTHLYKMRSKQKHEYVIKINTNRIRRLNPQEPRRETIVGRRGHHSDLFTPFHVFP